MKLQTENKQEYAAYLANRAEKCVKLLKCFMIAAISLLGVAVIFTVVLLAVKSFANLTEQALVTFTTVSTVVYFVIMSFIVALFIAVIISYVVAKINLTRLKGLDKEDK